jgi:TRAP-type C4-dicarboxylate transport system permease small subunit
MPLYTKFGQVMLRLLLVVGSVAMMVMMAIVVVNSLGRAFFKRPIFGTIEIAGLAGVVVVAVAVGFAERERRNVVVDVVANRFKPRSRALADAFALFLSLGAVAFLLWAVFNDSLYSLAVREVTLTTGISIAPFKFTWAIGLMILWLFLLQHMIEAIRKGWKR